MTHYADSSVLFSLYSSDANSARADLWRQANPQALPFTPLHRLELHSGLWRAVFQKRLLLPEAAASWRDVQADMAAGNLRELSAAFADVWREAEALVEPHTAETGSRSLDILHVASARLLGAPEFATFDQRQSSLANRVGLRLATI